MMCVCVRVAGFVLARGEVEEATARAKISEIWFVGWGLARHCNSRFPATQIKIGKLREDPPAGVWRRCELAYHMIIL